MWSPEKMGQFFFGNDVVKSVTEPMYDELVIGQEAQILPLFLLQLDPANFVELNAEYLTRNKDKE